jgi:hypothetical protein
VFRTWRQGRLSAVSRLPATPKTHHRTHPPAYRPTPPPPFKPDASLTRDVGLQTQLVKATRAEDNPPLVATATAVAHIEVGGGAPGWLASWLVAFGSPLAFAHATAITLTTTHD